MGQGPGGRPSAGLARAEIDLWEFGDGDPGRTVATSTVHYAARNPSQPAGQRLDDPGAHQMVRFDRVAPSATPTSWRHVQVNWTPEHRLHSYVDGALLTMAPPGPTLPSRPMQFFAQTKVHRAADGFMPAPSAPASKLLLRNVRLTPLA